MYRVLWNKWTLPKQVPEAITWDTLHHYSSDWLVVPTNPEIQIHAVHNVLQNAVYIYQALDKVGGQLVGAYWFNGHENEPTIDYATYWYETRYREYNSKEFIELMASWFPEDFVNFWNKKATISYDITPQPSEHWHKKATIIKGGKE
jgi:hypothetical protein